MATAWRVASLSHWLFLLLLSHGVLAQNLSDATLSQVESRLAEGAKQSWELGTRTQALLDLSAAEYSVFFLPTPPNLPPAASPPSDIDTSLASISSIARTVVNARPNSTGFDGAQPLFANDSSAGDPASMGVAVLLANWTNAGGADFAGAATQQLNFLLDVAPKSDDGAISHRRDQVQLWSDSVYMVPPFLAYYGITTNNHTLLSEAYNQVKLYHDALKDSNKSAGGLWKHIVMGNGEDPGHWSTGNAWAAQGILRVYATIRNSQFSNTMKHERSDLGNWVNEIHDGMYAHVDSSGLFHNYADDTSTFLDASSTALLAASVYRNALITGQHRHIPNAEKSRKALSAQSSTNSSALEHFDSNGWLTPVVNPHNVGVSGTQSPEGQAFVLEMQSAYQDWVAAGSQGINAAVQSIKLSTVWTSFLVILGTGILIV